jgi:hypothetical protein
MLPSSPPQIRHYLVDRDKEGAVVRAVSPKAYEILLNGMMRTIGTPADPSYKLIEREIPTNSFGKQYIETWAISEDDYRLTIPVYPPQTVGADNIPIAMVMQEEEHTLNDRERYTLLASVKRAKETLASFPPSVADLSYGQPVIIAPQTILDYIQLVEQKAAGRRVMAQYSMGANMVVLFIEINPESRIWEACGLIRKISSKYWSYTLPIIAKRCCGLTIYCVETTL